MQEIAVKNRFKRKHPELDWEDVKYLKLVDTGATSSNASKINETIAVTRILEEYARAF